MKNLITKKEEKEIYQKQINKRRAEALKELEEKKKKERDLFKEFESIWKD